MFTLHSLNMIKVFSRKILKMISKEQTGWEKMLPQGIAEIIKQHHLFGFDKNKLPEELS